jgi:hypothetical protein
MNQRPFGDLIVKPRLSHVWHSQFQPPLVVCCIGGLGGGWVMRMTQKRVCKESV